MGPLGGNEGLASIIVAAVSLFTIFRNPPQIWIHLHVHNRETSEPGPVTIFFF